MIEESEDPRIAATRQRSLAAALTLMVEHGALDVTHHSVSKATGISRSTLYRHWPTTEALRSDVFREAARIPSLSYRTAGTFEADLRWLLGNLIRALDETPWGRIAAHSVSMAATDDAVRDLLRDFMAERRAFVTDVIGKAKARGEIDGEVQTDAIFDIAIGAAYFRRLIEGLPLDDDWLDSHVAQICRLVGCRAR